MSQKVFVFDTTLRDGEQTPNTQLFPQQKLHIAHALEELGVDIIEAGFPISSPKDFESVKAISKEISRCSICALTRAVEKDIDVAADALSGASAPRIHTGIGVSDIHIEKKLRSTREQILARTTATVKHAKKYVHDVQFYAEDAGRAEPEFLAKVVGAAIKAGATTVNIPDTTGFCLPSQFAELVSFVFNNTEGIENANISVHCHNDLGLATANTLAGVLAGANQVEVTVNGIGERAGNASLEEIAAILATKEELGKSTRIQLEAIDAVSKLVSSETGTPIPEFKAIVGKNAYSHSSGIHQDGVLKDARTYESLSPKLFGNRDSNIRLTARSGRNALRHSLQQLGYEPDTYDIDHAYAYFLQIADTKKQLYSDDLRNIMKELC